MIADPADRSSTLRDEIQMEEFRPWLVRQIQAAAQRAQGDKTKKSRDEHGRVMWLLKGILAEYDRRALFEQPRQETQEEEGKRGVLADTYALPISRVDRRWNDAPHWRPIESAPKDRTPVLVWDGFDVMVSRFASESFGWSADALCAEEPTHWMPLPAPPVTGGAQPRTEEKDLGSSGSNQSPVTDTEAL